MKTSLVLAACAALGLAVSAQRNTPDAGVSKLTTVLADLARVVPQEGSITPQRASPAAPLSFDALPRSVQDAMRGRSLRIDANNEVQVYILLRSVTDEAVSQLAAAGVTIEIRDPDRRRVQARLAPSRLQVVSQLPIVNAIRLPVYGRRRIGQATTEGDAILHADQVRSELTLDGAGVRVGALSDGLKGVFDTNCTLCTGTKGPIATSDLPTSVGTRNASGVLTSSTGGIVGKSFQANGDLEGLPPTSPVCGFPGAGGEGTALLEIVHDIAPAAKLSFANADTDLAFMQAVNFLAASNDVVLDDIGFYGEPSDGTSAVSANTAAALNNPAYPIRAYFTSVGNDADEHYFGAYTDSGVDGTTIGGISNAGHLHLFQRTADTTDVLGLGSQPYNVIQLPQNGEVAIFLTWNDPSGASANNYDLYLVQQNTGRVVASSTDVQNGKQDPAETIDYVNRGAQDYFRIVVQNVQNAAQPRTLNLFSFQPECATAGPLVLASTRHERHNYNTPTRSVAAQSDAGGSPASVISVGAVCSASAAANGAFSGGNESCIDTSNSTIEFFSSQGPTLDGRVKPDITAVDGVAITGAGSFGSPFFGTSAAAPHMGGIAALVLQSAPCLMNRATSTIAAAAARTMLRNLLLDHAAALSGSSPDNVFGAGRADAAASVRPTLPSWRGSTTSFTFDGNNPFGASISASQLGFTDPNQCALTSLSWSGGCGTSPGSTMSCPFGTSSVTVSASNNGFGFSGSTDVQITVTDFSVNATPGSATVSPGQSASYVVTVAPVSGAFRSSVTLSCGNANLPAGTSCSFNPSTVTPGTGPVQSVLTISTGSALTAPSAPAFPTADARRRILPLAVWPAIAAALWIGLRRSGRRRAAFAAGAIAVAVIGVTVQAGVASGIAVFPVSLGFGSQTVNTTTPSQFVYVTNIGADKLTFTSILISGDFSQVSNCGRTLEASANCRIAVSFTPTATGSRSGSLTFIDDAPGGPHVVGLIGTGQAAPPSTGGTPAGTYAMIVSASAGTLTHTVPVTLVVQ